MGESKPSGISEIDALRATISVVEQQRENYRQDAKEALAQVSVLQAEVERTFQHRNDLMDSLVNLRVASAAATARAEKAEAEVERLQKVEGERDAALKAAAILLPFVDMAAGEGLEWSEQECGSPRMDAADLCILAAEALGFELGDDQYTALLKRGEGAIRAAIRPLTETEETSHAR